MHMGVGKDSRSCAWLRAGTLYRPLPSAQPLPRGSELLIAQRRTPRLREAKVHGHAVETLSHAHTGLLTRAQSTLPGPDSSPAPSQRSSLRRFHSWLPAPLSKKQPMPFEGPQGLWGL